MTDKKNLAVVDEDLLDDTATEIMDILLDNEFSNIERLGILEMCKLELNELVHTKCGDLTCKCCYPNADDDDEFDDEDDDDDEE